VESTEKRAPRASESPFSRCADFDFLPVVHFNWRCPRRGQVGDVLTINYHNEDHSAESTSASMRLKSEIVTRRSSILMMPSDWSRLKLRETNSRSVPICDAISGLFSGSVKTTPFLVFSPLL
jgi:hypothetical protein